MAQRSLEAPHMKIASMPFVLALLVSVAVTLTAGPSRASPDPLEGALGDVDADDAPLFRPWPGLARASSGRPVLGGRRGSASVSLTGFTREAANGRREVGGFVVLDWPLDRLAPGTRRVAMAEPAAYARDEGAPAPGLAQLELTSAAADERPLTLALTPRLARACVRAAWRAAGLGPDDARLDGIVSRARWSSLLPEARLRAIRSDDARLSLDTNAETSRVRDSAGANVGLEARLTFRLHRLVYSDDEPSFERIRLELRNARTRIGARVLDALFHWQRARLDLQTLPPSQRGTRDEADAVLRVLEAEAALDVLTNGWFSSRGDRAATEIRVRQSPSPSRSEDAPAVPVGAGDL